VSVRARHTSSLAAPANFSFAFTDPALDWDVSKHVQQDGLLEIGISQVRGVVIVMLCYIWFCCTMNHGCDVQQDGLLKISISQARFHAVERFCLPHHKTPTVSF
jgi:hypothetical protein